jgi:hypothetical protein
MGEWIAFAPDAAQYLLWKLLCLERWPDVAQAKLDEQSNVYEYRLQRERELVQQLKNAPPHDTGLLSWWTVLTAGVVGTAIGIMIPVILGGS